jgi:anti-anti-sigma factor
VSDTPPLIECRHEFHGTDVLLVVTGEIDLSTAQQFRRELTDLIAAAHSPAFVDLSAVVFMDSTGLNALMDASRAAEATGVDFVVIAPRGRAVRKVLDVSGVSEHLDVRDEVLGVG